MLSTRGPALLLTVLSAVIHASCEQSQPELNEPDFEIRKLPRFFAYYRARG